MLFNAPQVILMIPDIKKIYEINDPQCDELETAIDTLDQNIFLDQMDENTISRWEKILKIIHLDDDTLEDRRFRVKSKVLEKLPYSYRVIVNRLNTLCPDGYTLEISTDRTFLNVKLSLKSKKMVEDVAEMLEDILPLNIIYKIEILYNTYGMFSSFTHAQMANYTHGELRDHIFE